MLKPEQELPQKAEAEAGRPAPPPLPEIGRRLAPICQKHGITALEAFGSVARQSAGPGSDVDLIAHFNHVPGLRYFDIEDEMSQALGVPVHLLTRQLVDEMMKNPFMRPALVRDRIRIYGT